MSAEFPLRAGYDLGKCSVSGPWGFPGEEALPAHTGNSPRAPSLSHPSQAGVLLTQMPSVLASEDHVLAQLGH